MGNQVPIWYLVHRHPRPNEDDAEHHLGVFDSEERAWRAAEHLRSKPGFRDWPEGFAVFTGYLNEVCMEDGFETLYYDVE